MESLDSSLSYVFRLLGSKRKYNYAQIGISSQCTHSCIMCPQTIFRDQWVSSYMTLKTFERIANNFPNISNIYLSGWGEPLLNPHFLEMTRIAKEAGCTTGFTTNGSRLDTQTIKQLIDDNVDLISISLAGATATTHNSKRIGSKFDDLIGKIKQIQKTKKQSRSENPRILLLFMMFKDNLSELPEAIQLAQKLDIGSLVATNLDYVGNVSIDKMRAFSCQESHKTRDPIITAKELAKKLNVDLTVFPLSMGSPCLCTEDPLNNLYISENGSISPCVYLYPPMSDIPRIFCGEEVIVSRTCYGNINEKSLKEIWEGKAYSLFRAQLKDIFEGKSSLLPKECGTCYKAYGL